jgi:hypothetical protein
MVQVRVSVTRVRGNMMQSWISEGCRTGQDCLQRWRDAQLELIFSGKLLVTHSVQIAVEQCSGRQSHAVPEMRRDGRSAGPSSLVVQGNAGYADEMGNKRTVLEYASDEVYDPQCSVNCDGASIVSSAHLEGSMSLMSANGRAFQMNSTMEIRLPWHMQFLAAARVNVVEKPSSG